jgi:hypothetical protein
MRFLTRLGLGVLLAAVAVGINLVPALQQTGITQTVVRSTIVALVLIGLWRGLSATKMPAATRRNRWLTVAVTLIAWLAVTWTVAVEGVFQQGSSADFLLPLAVILPLIIGLPFLLRSSWLGEVLDVIPPGWLIGLQVYRVFGSVFIFAWASSALPGAFALPAGAGDTLVGILALPVAVIVSRNRAAGVGWNLLGILDLVNAFLLSTLTVQGQLPFPFLLIPSFVVPLSVLLHAVSLRQLRRGALSARQSRGATTASVAGFQYSPYTPANYRAVPRIQQPASAGRVEATWPVDRAAHYR